MSWSSRLLPIVSLVVLATQLYLLYRQPHIPPINLSEPFHAARWSGSGISQSGLAVDPAGEILLQRNFQEPPSFVFVHIPKCGGSSITEYLKTRMHQECDELMLDRPASLEAAKKVAFGMSQAVSKGMEKGLSLDDAQRLVLERNPPSCFYSHLLAGPDGDSRPRLLQAVAMHGIRVRYVIGHVPFGYCFLMQRNCSYVTVLRDPIERVFSHYHYLKNNLPTYLKETCGGNCPTFKDFVYFMAKQKLMPSRATDFDNLQTRMVAGDAMFATLLSNNVCNNGLNACDLSQTTHVDEAMLEVAKENMRKSFKVVGILEDLPKFTKLLEAEYGLEESAGPPLKSVNVKGIQYIGEDITDEDETTLKLLQYTQRYDVELYKYGKQLMLERYRERFGSPRK